MAPLEKKIEKKPVDPVFDLVEIIIIFILISTFLTTLLPTIVNYVSSGELSFFGFKFNKLTPFFSASLPFIKYLAFVLGGALVVGTFIYNKKADAIWAAEKARLYPSFIPGPSSNNESNNHTDPILKKWQQIKIKSESPDENDWRIAIIEADIILDTLLERLNLPGVTIGDKLKAVEPSDFLTLDSAWEAHKARNKIAHHGSDFLLNQREVARVISLYEEVFKEFRIV